MEYIDFLTPLQSTHPDLFSKIERFTSLEHILNGFLLLRGISLAALEMVTQDEYCHDLFFPLPDSSEWLVFGMT